MIVNAGRETGEQFPITWMKRQKHSKIMLLVKVKRLNQSKQGGNIFVLFDNPYFYYSFPNWHVSMDYDSIYSSYLLFFSFPHLSLSENCPKQHCLHSNNI